VAIFDYSFCQEAKKCPKNKVPTKRIVMEEDE
jgi:hypothetical protein